jgi:DNA-binding response OmpR family regulator
LRSAIGDPGNRACRSAARDVLGALLAGRHDRQHRPELGPDLLDLVRSARPDLVVLDIMMPKMDGLEVLAALKGDAATKEIPVVMLTAKSSDADLWSGWEAGADYYITKPFDLEELLRFIGYLQVNGQLAN